MRSTFGWYRNTVKREAEAQASHSCKASGLLVVSTVRVWAPEDSLWVSQAEQAHRGLEVLGRPPNPRVQAGCDQSEMLAVGLEWFLHLEEAWPLLSSPVTRPLGSVHHPYLLPSFHPVPLGVSLHFQRLLFQSGVLFLLLDQAFLHLHLFSLFPLWSLSTAQSCLVVLGST